MSKRQEPRGKREKKRKGKRILPISRVMMRRERAGSVREGTNTKRELEQTEGNGRVVKGSKLGRGR